MQFRKTGIFFFEMMISLTLILLIQGFCMIYVKAFNTIFIIIFLMMLLLLVTFPFGERHIIVDDDGITCRSHKKQIWSFKWSEIKELRLSSWGRNPALYIILIEYDHTDIDNLKIIEQDLYFQYGRKAKQAIRQYCKCPIVKQK